jgi:hypothetical protein
MRWILDQVEGQPIYLGCTRRGNVLFYQSFGFRVVEEVELVDDDSFVRSMGSCWGGLRVIGVRYRRCISMDARMQEVCP